VLEKPDEGGKDREQSFQYLTSNFLPNGTIEIAYKSDKTRLAEATLAGSAAGEAEP
jgi:hypothetical protein